MTATQTTQRSIAENPAMRDPLALTRRVEVGRRLRGVRLAGGFTQAQLSRSAGIGQASLSNYESGRRELPLAAVVRLAAALEVSVGYLLEVSDIVVLRDPRLGRALRVLGNSPAVLESLIEGTLGPGEHG